MEMETIMKATLHITMAPADSMTPGETQGTLKPVHI
jgi:hypothetical protein